MTNRIYSFLGLATRAGKLLSGEDTCERVIRSGKAELVLVAEDASDNTKKNFADMCSFRGIALRYFGQKELLGKHTGKEIRAVIALIDDQFATRLIEMIDNNV